MHSAQCAVRETSEGQTKISTEDLYAAPRMSRKTELEAITDTTKIPPRVSNIETNLQIEQWYDQKQQFVVMW